MAINKKHLILGIVVLLILYIIFSGTCKTKEVTVKNTRKTIVTMKKTDKNVTKRLKKKTTLRNESSFRLSERKMIKVYDLKLKGKYDETIEKLEKLIEKSRNSDSITEAKSMYELARMYMVKKNFKDAISMFKEFMKKYPGHEQKENAERALEYINNYDKFKKEFVNFEVDIMRKR